MKLGFILVQMFAVVLGVQASTPGKVAVWKTAPAAGGSSIHHNTKSVSLQQAADHVHKIASDSELVVLLRSAVEGPVDLLSVGHIVAEVKSSTTSAEILSNVHREPEEAKKNVIDHILNSQSAQSLCISSAIETLQGDNELSRTLDVSLDTSSAKDVALLPQLFAAVRARATNKKAVFVAVEEPSSDAMMPIERGNYVRLLSANPAGKESKPSKASGSGAKAAASTPIAGTEFSIYSEGQYLYITPDIFTGLMTGLFMVTVALLGFSCMGSIQGISSFYDKVPSNGREA